MKKGDRHLPVVISRGSRMFWGRSQSPFFTRFWPMAAAAINNSNNSPSSLAVEPSCGQHAGCNDMSGNTFVFRGRVLDAPRHDAISMPLLELPIVFHQPSRIVIDGSGYLMSDFANFVNGRIGFHGVSPRSSSGVTRDGTYRPRRVLTRRIWPNLLAFAKCRQFHVTRKSHL